MKKMHETKMTQPSIIALPDNFIKSNFLKTKDFSNIAINFSFLRFYRFHLDIWSIWHYIDNLWLNSTGTLPYAIHTWFHAYKIEILQTNDSTAHFFACILFAIETGTTVAALIGVVVHFFIVKTIQFKSHKN